MKTKGEKRLFRLLSIVKKLYDGKTLMSLALSDEFMVSQRSINRDIVVLSEAGFPVDTGFGGRYNVIKMMAHRKPKQEAQP